MKKYTDEDKICLAQAIVDARQEDVAAMKTKINPQMPQYNANQNGPQRHPPNPHQDP